MNTNQRILFLFPILLSSSVDRLYAQASCDPVNAIQNCSANELVRMLGDSARAALAEGKAKDTGDAVVNTNRATTPSDPFASRVHASFQDFLVPLSFAINSVEESDNGRSLIVRFNPLREPPLVGGFTITATKPALNTRVQEAIPSDSRDTAVKQIEEDFDDLGDITFSGSTAIETTECTEQKSRCWGRNPRTYRQLLSKLLLDDRLIPNRSGVDQSNSTFIELGRLLQSANASFDTKLSALPNGTREAAIAAARNLVAAEMRDREEHLQLLDELAIDHLAMLIDNQPQIALTASWRDRDEVVGPTEVSATLEVQIGRYRLNRVKNDCQSTFQECLVDSLQNVEDGTGDATDKFVFSASFKETDPFRLTANDVGIPDFVAIDEPRVREWSAKAQWGVRLGMAIANQRARFDLSAEGIRVTAGDELEKEEVIGTATLTLPVASNMSVPISLKYGNRPDLLRDVRDRWGAHIGFSYRLPWEFNAQ